MRIVLAVALLLFANFAQAEDPVRGRLLFLGVAYDEAPPQKFTVDHFNYAPDNFSRMFQEQSRELFHDIHVETLKGNAATREAVLAKLNRLKSTAKPKDLVFLYWGTHGSTVQHDWEANLPGNRKILGREIKTRLAELPCPAVVVISTCGSGGFIRPNSKMMELPDNVAAFCACRRRQSTNNELDVTLLEALSGFSDLDQDGQVTLKEALHYVPRRYRKLMKDAEGSEVEPVLGHSPGFPIDRPLAKSSDRRVAVAYEGVWYGAQVLEPGKKNGKVRYLGWDSTSKGSPFSFPDEVVKPEAIDAPGGFPPVEVRWNGTWYPATIVERRGERFQIHYVGYPESDDEAVPLNRIRYPFIGETLSLEKPN